jgi:hypothetical protein
MSVLLKAAPGRPIATGADCYRGNTPKALVLYNDWPGVLELGCRGKNTNFIQRRTPCGPLRVL